MAKTGASGEEIGYLINDITRLLRRVFDARVRDYGLTSAQLRILSPLFESDGLTQKDLADQIDMEAAPTGRMLDKLEESGWITRCPDENDRRVRRVYITKKVNPYSAGIKKEVEKLFDVALDGCGAQQKQVFAQTLELMRANLAKEIS